MKKIVLKAYKRLKSEIVKPIKYIIIYLKYSNKLKRFKNIHKGERCFIIGNGPSLRIEDLDKLKNEYTFAANKIYLAFEDTTWRPTYYCIVDDKLILTDLESIIKNVEAKVKFIQGNPLVLRKIFLPNWIYFFNDGRKYYPKKPKFSENIVRRICQGYSVTYYIIQLAVYMGFKELYLIGVDHNYSLTRNADGTIIQTEKKNHFSDKYFNENDFHKQIIDQKANIPRLEETTLAYQVAKEYADTHGIKIYNATRGGKLEVFERVDFDRLFN